MAILHYSVVGASSPHAARSQRLGIGAHKAGSVVPASSALHPSPNDHNECLAWSNAGKMVARIRFPVPEKLCSCLLLVSLCLSVLSHAVPAVNT